MNETGVTGEFADVYERLAVRFVPPLRFNDVRRCIEDAAATFASAPIRTYVVVLVERIATDRLRAAVEARQVVPVRPDRPIEANELTPAAAAS
jgi:hypothetical protein